MAQRGLERPARVMLRSGDVSTSDSFDDVSTRPFSPCREEARRDRAATVRVLLGDAVEVVELPRKGTALIGRTRAADVVIADPGVSREHARLTVGQTLLVEDLGSANGTFVRGVEVEPGQLVEVFSDDIIDIGKAMLIVQDPSRVPKRSRILDYERLIAKLREVISGEEPRGLCVVRVDASSALDLAVVQSQLSRTVRPYDLVAPVGAGIYWALLIDCEPAAAEATLNRVRTALGDFAPRLSLGRAHFPSDGMTVDELLNVTHGNSTSAPEVGSNQVVVLDEAMDRIHRLIDRIGVSRINVVVAGETGVGKEILAKKIHTVSPRRDAEFVAVNCATLDDTLLESKLFGHVSGAFTGARENKTGLVELADGGTLFLDEIGELPMETQGKLLRVLEDGSFMPVGATKARSSDVRVVAATNRDLLAEIELGRFREDLYYRLAGVTIEVPPLRERKAEIYDLAVFFAEFFAKEDGYAVPAISPEAQDSLLKYDWPGNVRELRNVIQRAVVLAVDGKIDADLLPRRRCTTDPEPIDGLLKDAVAVAEKQRVQSALKASDGNQTAAAKSLGISRSTLLRRMKQYGFS